MMYGYGRSYESELESNRNNHDRTAGERAAHLGPINEKLRAEVKEIDAKIQELQAEIEINKLKADQHEKAMQLHLHSKAKEDGSNEGMAPLPKGQVNAVLRYV